MLHANRVSTLVFISFFGSITVAGEIADEQKYIDATIRDIFSRAPLSYNVLHGGGLAQMQVATVEPKAVVIRKLAPHSPFVDYIKEFAVGCVCSELTIGPRLYAAEPSYKLLFSEYLEAKAVPCEKFGEKPFLQELGSLMARFHTIDCTQLQEIARKQCDYMLDISKHDLFAINDMNKKIESTSAYLELIGVSVAQLQEWYSYFKQQLDQLDTIHGSKMVVGHGDLHWGNCLYAYDRIWLIDYESVGIMPWWYDLGVLGAHFSFFEDEDEFLLEGYVGLSKNFVEPVLKKQYQCMKYIAMLYYALFRLDRFGSTEVIQQAIDSHPNLQDLHAAYRNNTFSLNTQYAEVQVSIAMIRHVGEIYKKIMAA